MTPPPTSSTPLLVSFLFALENERGHLYEYNKAAGEAARLAGWEHRAAVRAAARFADLPPGWELCLGSANTRMPKGPLAKLEKGWRLFLSLANYLSRQAQQNRPVILFLEWYNVVHLLPFTLALASVSRRESFYIWVVDRLEAGHDWPARANRFLIRCLTALVAGRLTHLSDSEIVARDVAQFGYAVHLLPIPHTAHFAAAGARPADQAKLVVAWLAGLAMPVKGVELVRPLTALACPEAESLQIVASQSSHFIQKPGACQIRLVPDVLPRSDYLAWMQNADVILQPYDPAFCWARTSGIFVEAIVAGNRPVVTDGTWMAHELRKYGLDQLILDWNSPTILSDLLRVARAEDVRVKLARMQSAYADYHSVPGFAKTIQHVFDETRQ
jgi:hypothetical protein